MTNDFKPAKAGGNQLRLSKEEYAEKKRAEKEKVYQMIDDAAREIHPDCIHSKILRYHYR